MTLSVHAARNPAEAAQAFEATMLGEMLKPMFATVNSATGLFGGGDGEATWRPMLVEEMGKHIAAHGGIGIAAHVLRQMLQMQEAGQ
jgi:Rod binding domain-containing protein